MLITQEVEINWSSKNRKWYESKGYIFTKCKDKFLAKIEDLSKGCSSVVNVKCDCEECKTPYLKPIKWQDYLKCVKEDGKYYCRKCAMKLYGKENARKTRLKNSKSFEKWCIENNKQYILDVWDYELNNCQPNEILFSTATKYYFKCPNKLHESELKQISSYTSGCMNIKCNKCNSFEQWCINNNRQDILNRWDCELNACKPDEINYGTEKKYYFKCPKNIHKSELKNISSFTGGQEGSMNCNKCSSIAQYLIDMYGEYALSKYWDYEKNIINPWNISKFWDEKIWIKCQEKDYHDSYNSRCADFATGHRCPYCYGKQTHPLDSLGALYPESLKVWSDKNGKSPYEYSPRSMQEVYWKCPDNTHKDYLRTIDRSNILNFRCPECQYSKGEKAIEQYFMVMGFKKDEDYIPQKDYYDLLGVKDGLLSYDFYLPDYNLLIEYQGEQHEKPIDFKGKGKKYAKEKFKIQQEHDKRKREYANNHNINLLEIWYWDFNRIEEILEKELLHIL